MLLNYSSNEARCRRNRDGYTLIEIVVAMFLFMLVALGITAMAIQSQRISRSNIERNTAYTVVQGYIEQIKSLSIGEIKASIANNNIPLATVGISSTQTGNIEIADPLLIGQANTKAILLDLLSDGQGGESSITINVYITPTINDLSNESIYGVNALPAIEIILNFEYDALHLGTGQRLAGSLRIIKADITE